MYPVNQALGTSLGRSLDIGSYGLSIGFRGFVPWMKEIMSGTTGAFDSILRFLSPALHGLEEFATSIPTLTDGL